MRTRVRAVLASLVALSATVPAVILTTAAPASASPVGYTLLVTDIAIDAAEDGTTTTTGDVSAQQFAECQLAQVDLGTGVVTPLSHNGEDACVDDLTMSPDGRVFGIQQQCFDGEVIEICPFFPLEEGAAATDGFGATQFEDVQVHLIEFDPATGVPTDLGAINGTALTSFIIPTPLGFGGITFDEDGNLYVEMIGEEAPCSGNAYCLYLVDPANLSNPTFVGTGTEETFFEILAAGCGSPEAVTLMPTVLFGGGDGTGTEALPSPDKDLFARDLATGATTLIGSTGEDNIIDGMAFDTAGVLWGIGIVIGGDQTVFTIDTTTGAATPTVELQTEEFLAIGLALPLDCPEDLVVAFTG